MRNIYENMYNMENRMELRRNPRVLEMIKIVDELNLKNKNILDIGCYDGLFLSMISNRENNFYGLEASEYGIAHCENKKINAQKFFWDDQIQMPYQDNFFDLIIAGEIIEHIYDTDYFLNEIKRILKSNGYLIISTPNLASFGRRILLLLGANPLTEISLAAGNAGHIRYFTFRLLFELLGKNGFRVLKEKSDVINFSKRGRPHSKFMADIFPFFGQSIIYLAKKI